MTNRKFVASVILTIMDALVFVLCVDKGLQPVAIVGACYVALRLFSQDAHSAVNLIEPVGNAVVEGVKALVNKAKEAKKDPELLELHDNV